MEMNSATSALFLLLISVLSDLNLCDRCCEINSRMLPRYRLMRSHARSNEPTISRKEVRDLDKCKEFSASKKALAFNFRRVPDDAKVRGLNESLQSDRKMCQALQCPESSSFTTLVRDRNSNYYSMYQSHIFSKVGDIVCVPRAGIFVFSKKSSNYTQAQASCQKSNGSLAHVISEERTDGLAKYISRGTPTFVGLSSRGDERIWKNEFDEPLSCFEYRAWGKGEPSHSRGCIGLVQSPEINSEPFWKVLPCNAEFPFACEISPMQSSRSNRNIRAGAVASPVVERLNAKGRWRKENREK